MVVFYSHHKARPLWRLDTRKVRTAIRRHGLVTMEANAQTNLGHSKYKKMGRALQLLGMNWEATPLVVLYRPCGSPLIVANRQDYNRGVWTATVLDVLQQRRIGVKR